MWWEHESLTHTFVVTSIKALFIYYNFCLLIIYSNRIGMEIFTKQFTMWNKMKFEVPARCKNEQSNSY